MSDAKPTNAGSSESSLSVDPWQQLKRFTRARIALGRAGSSLPTKEVLAFGMAHAVARDAVHRALDAEALGGALRTAGFSVCQVHSRAADRATYLLRPDLGRRLDEASLETLTGTRSATPPELLIVVGDGLSSLAVERHALPLLQAIRAAAPAAWRALPVVIARQARVAIGDEIGAALNARMVAMLIGERPGLSSPDSLGIYLTYAPRLGRQDAERNCISNVRPEGLGYADAARKLLWLAREASVLQRSGVVLKDESDVAEIGEPDRLKLAG
jgi:ethanolamine ammonia-lyase small subunit